MIEISNQTSGIFLPDDNSPVLVPSFNNGGATATQSGFIITVTCVNSHNISSNFDNGITNNNVRVYIAFASVIPSGVFSNIIIATPKIFRCLSSISRTVTTPVNVTPLGSGNISVTDLSTVIPGNTLKLGSSIKIEAMVSMPSSGVATRSMTLGIGVPTSPFLFSTSAVTSDVTANFYLIQTMIGFLSNTDFIKHNGAAATKVVNSVINTQSNISICPSVKFGTPVTNDYQLWNIIKMSCSV